MGARQEYVCVPGIALLFACLLVYGLVCGGCERAAPTDHAPDGKALYAAYCLSCHGADGRNDRSGALSAMRLDRANALPEAQWNALVQNGRGAMPAFTGRLGASQMTALRAYVRQMTSP